MEELLEALARATGAMENPKFDSTNPHFRSKFASLAACEAVVRPKLAENGIMYRQTCQIDESGRPWLVTMAYGKGGEVEMSRVPLVLVANDPQKQGSALTYAKRYGLCAAFGLAGEEDDDGNAASAAPQPAQKAQKPSYKASTPPKPQSAPDGQAQAPQGQPQDGPTLTSGEMDTLRQCFVNYRDALGLDGNAALAKLLEETGIETFGEHMSQQEFQKAQIAMGRAIARASGATVVDG